MKLITVLLMSLFVFNAHALDFDQDVPAGVKSQFLSDLDVVKTFQGTKQTPIHKQIFGKLDGQTYLKFFNDRISSVGLDTCGGGAAVMACVQPFIDSHKMWLTNNLLTSNSPQAARILVIFHESRHSEDENGNWMHAYCPTPFLDENGKDIVGLTSGVKLEGLPACDTEILGAYGVGIFMMKNIEKYCENCSEKLKMDAALFANDQVKRFYQPEVKKKALADFAL